MTRNKFIRILGSSFAVGCLFSFATASASNTRSTFTGEWVDNYGKYWALNSSSCLNGNAFCVTGARDSANTLNCGALPVRGTEVYNNLGDDVITLTVYSSSANCAVSSWYANYDSASQSFTGFVTNVNGQQTPFTLKRGNSIDAPHSAYRGYDPSRYYPHQ